MKRFLCLCTALLLTVMAVACTNRSVGQAADQTSESINTDAAPVTDALTSPDTERNSTLDTEGATEPDTEALSDALDAINQLRPDYDLGTCRDLRGNVSVVLFYMDDFESDWTAEEAEAFTENEVKPGLEFLEKAAREFGVSLNLTVKQAYTSLFYDDEVITSVRLTGLATIDVLEQAAGSLDYASAEAMIQAMREEYQTDEVVCLTLFNKNGTAYAINPQRGETMKVEEHCIVFAYDLNSDRNDPVGCQSSVVAHEMLHLFGAEDFYATANRKALAQSKYPKDLMLSAQYYIRNNNIGEATAFYVGWTDEVPDVLYDQDWQE